MGDGTRVMGDGTHVMGDDRHIGSIHLASSFDAVQGRNFSGAQAVQ